MLHIRRWPKASADDKNVRQRQMRFPVFLASRQPLPKSFVEALCIMTCLGLIAQTIYAYRKGVIYFGHPNGGVGSGSWGTPYNRISRGADPKKFRRVFCLSVFLSILFLAASICIHVFFPPNP